MPAIISGNIGIVEFMIITVSLSFGGGYLCCLYNNWSKLHRKKSVLNNEATE